MNTQKSVNIFLCLMLVCFLGGFCIAATSPDNVFIGLFVMGIGIVFAVPSIISMANLIKQQNEQKEDRIRRLEEEVYLLKKTNRL